jgi:hypothetical protein
MDILGGFFSVRFRLVWKKLAVLKQPGVSYLTTPY